MLNEYISCEPVVRLPKISRLVLGTHVGQHDNVISAIFHDPDQWALKDLVGKVNVLREFTHCETHLRSDVDEESDNVVQEHVPSMHPCHDEA